MSCVVVCIALGVDVFWGGTCTPLYIQGDRFTWKVLAEYSWNPTIARSGSFLCTATSSTPIRVVYKRGKVHPWAIPYSRTFYACKQSRCLRSDSALERRDLEIDIIAHLEMEFMAATIGVSLLTRLSNTKILMNNLDLVFGILHQIWTKERPFPRLGPIDRSPTPSSIEGFKRGHFDTCLITIVIGELREWQASNPFLFIDESTSS